MKIMSLLVSYHFLFSRFNVLTLCNTSCPCFSSVYLNILSWASGPFVTSTTRSNMLKAKCITKDLKFVFTNFRSLSWGHFQSLLFITMLVKKGFYGDYQTWKAVVKTLSKSAIKHGKMWNTQLVSFLVTLSECPNGYCDKILKYKMTLPQQPFLTYISEKHTMAESQINISQLLH